MYSKLLLASFIAFSFFNSAIADNFVQTSSAKKIAKISPLTPFDEALKKEMQKYPKDSAFFVDGRTGKIISVNKLPKNLKQSQSSTPQVKQPKSAETIPYKMQEERIYLLQ
ncbi:MAG: hypothetical protein SOW25_03090 [Helicobacter sp.]|nr:hypothetical protein [Helicobacteraceae bacterium]MDY3113296.1 hypothetical protein [Helicobacter sp.]